MLTILLSLFHISSAIAAPIWAASMTAIVHTSVGYVRVYGDAQINVLEPANAQHPDAAYIPEVIVPVDQMSASKFGVMSVLKGESFFNASEYPEVVVREVSIHTNYSVIGTLHIKNHLKTIQGIWKQAPDGRIRIEFNISISDFELAHRALVFNIDDQAKIQVEMPSPF